MPLHVSSANIYEVLLGARSYGKWLGSNYELNIVPVPEVLIDSVENRLMDISFQHHVASTVGGAQTLLS